MRVYLLLFSYHGAGLSAVTKCIPLKASTWVFCLKEVLLVLSSCPSVVKLDAPTLATHIYELSLMKRLVSASIKPSQVLRKNTENAAICILKISTQSFTSYFTKGQRQHVCSCWHIQFFGAHEIFILGSQRNILTFGKYIQMIMAVTICYVKNLSLTWCQITEGTRCSLLASQHSILFVLMHTLAGDEIKIKQGPAEQNISPMI